MLTRLVNNRCLELGRIKQNEQEALKRIRQEYGVLPHNPYAAAGMLGEFYTRMKVEALARRYCDVDMFWMMRPIVTRDYVFTGKKKSPNICVKRSADNRLIGEVDLVMLVKDAIRGMETPVVIETHLARYHGGGPATVRKMLSPERVQRKRALMRSLFNQVEGGKYDEPVVVYVVPREQLRNLAVRESNMFQFVADGGLIVPFHRTRKGWIEEVEHIIAQCNGKKTDAPENGHKQPLSV